MYSHFSRFSRSSGNPDDIYIKVLSSVLANITSNINTVLEYDRVEHPSKSIRIFAFQNCFYYNFLIPLAEARIVCYHDVIERMTELE